MTEFAARHDQEPAKDVTQEMLANGYHVEAVYNADQVEEFNKRIVALQEEGADFKYNEKWGNTTSPQERERMVIYVKPKAEKTEV